MLKQKRLPLCGGRRSCGFILCLFTPYDYLPLWLLPVVVIVVMVVLLIVIVLMAAN
jgi:hypothetical protein